jgi:hypothetical protein
MEIGILIETPHSLKFELKPLPFCIESFELISILSYFHGLKHTLDLVMEHLKLVKSLLSDTLLFAEIGIQEEGLSTRILNNEGFWLGVINLGHTFSQ